MPARHPPDVALVTIPSLTDMLINEVGAPLHFEPAAYQPITDADVPLDHPQSAFGPCTQMPAPPLAVLVNFLAEQFLPGPQKFATCATEGIASSNNKESIRIFRHPP